MKRFLKYFILAFGIMFVVSLLVSLPFFGFPKGPIISAIAGMIFGFFCSGFMQRTLKTEELFINASNKDPQKGLRWYEEQIRDTLYSFRFTYTGTIGNVEHFKASGLYQVFESNIELEVSPFEIRLRASRLQIRIIKDLLTATVFGN